MQEKKTKLTIGFITYGKSTAKYLPYFLPSLTADAADYADDGADDFKILCFDNSEEEDNENIEYIKKNRTSPSPSLLRRGAEIEIMRAGGNLGFAKAYNKMIKRARELGAEYFLALNSDMVLEKGAIRKMVEALDNDSELGSVCPKILKWDFANNKKTDIIDSCGIILKSGLRFVNLGEGEKDNNFGNYKILGPAGTAAMYRMSALEKIKEDENYFDELMFMYKEDCDLAYRLFLEGFESRCISDAIMHHDRTVQKGGKGIFAFFLNRRARSKRVRQWSFLNQHIIFIKYWNLQNWINKLAIIWYVFRMFIFVLIFEQYLLKEYISLVKIWKNVKIVNSK